MPKKTVEESRVLTEEEALRRLAARQAKHKDWELEEMTRVLARLQDAVSPLGVLTPDVERYRRSRRGGRGVTRSFCSC